jgi:hypothetical protein
MKGLNLIIGSIVIAAGILYFAFGPRPAFDLDMNRGGTIEEGTSGIEGEVRLGPTCPGQRVPPGEDNCADKLYQAEFELLDFHGTTVVREFSSDEQGKFKISVPAGEYMIRNKDQTQPFPTCGKTGTIPVESEEFTSVIVFCDTGIR